MLTRDAVAHELDVLAKEVAAIMQRINTLRQQVRRTVDRVPTTVAVVSGNSQTALVGATTALPCTVVVKDQQGVVMSGQPVLFSISGDGAVADTVVVSDGSGEAATTPTLGSIIGSYTVTATVNGVPLPATFSLTATIATASVLVLVSGDNQTGPVSTQLADACVVQVQDQFGNGVAGETVTFAVATGGGSLSLTEVVTDVDGLASTDWTLGSPTGQQTIRATASGLTGSPLTLTASATAGTATQIVIVSGDSQTGVVAGGAAAACVAEVRDAGGNPVQGYTVTAVVSVGQGTLDAASQVSDASGRVSFVYTTRTLVEAATVLVAAPGLTNSPLAYSITSVAGAVAGVAFAIQPQSSVTSGVVWTQQPRVQLVDQYGNAKAQSGASISLSIVAGAVSFSAGTTSGTTNASGYLQFSGLAVTGSGVSTVRATDGTFTVDSNTVSVTTPTAAVLVMGQQPTTVTVGVPISPAVTVRVEDGAGNLVNTSTAQVTGQKKAGTGGAGAITGTLVRNAVGGIATFNDLVPDTEATGYQLEFASPDFGAPTLTGVTSASFDVAAAAADHRPVDIATLVSLRDFTSRNDNGWGGFPDVDAQWVTNLDLATYDGGGLYTPGLPSSGSPKGAEVVYPTGFVAGNGPVDRYYLGGVSTDAAWIRFRFKPSANWYGNQSNTWKLVQTFFNKSGTRNLVIYSPHGKFNQALHPAIVFQSIVGINGDTVSQPNPFVFTGVTFVRDQWNEWIIVIRNNTAGTYDGSVETWANGVQAHSITGIQFTAAGSKIQQPCEVNPIYGGSGNAVPAQQGVLLADLEFWKK